MWQRSQGRKVLGELEELSDTPVAGQRGRWLQMRWGRASPRARVRHSDASLTAVEVAGVKKGFFLSITRGWIGRCKRTSDSAASDGLGISFNIF